jgi:hypothetical protein
MLRELHPDATAARHTVNPTAAIVRVLGLALLHAALARIRDDARKGKTRRHQAMFARIVL